MRWAGTVVLATVAIAFAAGCGADQPEVSAETAPPATSAEAAGEAASGTTAAETEPQPGGVYRVGWEASFNFSNAFDPTGEYFAPALDIYSDLLIRTLLGYRHVAGPAGNELIPDLAEDFPDVSADGLTWTFRLKDGVVFGPPVSREITSEDVRYAFERIGTESLVAQYGFYYDVIEGMAEFKAGEADEIRGIATPDERTIVFTLTEPTGDFGYRVSMPATGPIPEEVAKCFTKAGEYGRYVVSSGPYMIEGSDALDATSCQTMKPISGYHPNRELILVRNPSYDPATDTPEARENYPDRFEFVINANNEDIFNKIEAGELEGEQASVTPKILRRYTQDAELHERLHVNPTDSTFYLSMNLTQPPFDDVHVRRAVNLAMDKTALRLAWGGPLAGEIATHVLPNAMLDNVLADYDPYPSPDFAGDVEAARAEMAQSRYDTDGDGVCDAPACEEVVNIAGAEEIGQALIPVVQDSLARIGIELETRVLEDWYLVIQEVARNIPLAQNPGWGKDYPDASTFMVLFASDSIIPTGNINYSLVGLTPGQAAGIKGLDGSVEGIPSIDADIAACTPLTGEERVQCWAAVDRKLMEEIVPWVPWLNQSEADVVGPTVTKYEFDQLAGYTAYAHVAVDASKQ
jgi:peptide/nickel transport system substrate-binding protein